MTTNGISLKAGLLFVIFVSVILTVGCGDPRAPKGPTGTVSGTVKYKGAPLTVGSIVFRDPATAKGGAAPLGPDVSYTISIPLEVGEYNVGFPAPTSPPPSVVADAKPVPSPLPSKYRSPEQGTVKFTIVKGQNTADFDLE